MAGGQKRVLPCGSIHLASSFISHSPNAEFGPQMKLKDQSSHLARHKQQNTNAANAFHFATKVPQHIQQTKH